MTISLQKLGLWGLLALSCPALAARKKKKHRAQTDPVSAPAVIEIPAALPPSVELPVASSVKVSEEVAPAPVAPSSQTSVSTSAGLSATSAVAPPAVVTSLGSTSTETPSLESHKTQVLTKHPGFLWPLDNPLVINYYGWRKKRRMHDGVDLRALLGTPVFPTAGGEVIHAGKGLKGYGRLVVIDHGKGWSSVYAHLSKIFVRVGQKVEPSDMVGLSGKTGHAHGPHLHFEIRKGADPLDPLLFLSTREGVNSSVDAR